MRAVYLLLCLALASFSAANIVRHQLQPQMDTLFVQPLAYVDQYQQRTHSHRHQHHSESASQESRESKESRENQNSRQSQKSRESESESKEHFTNDDIHDYPSSFRSVNKNWNSPLFTKVITKGQQIPYSDAIEWRGVQIAAGPKSPVKDKKDIAKIFNDAYKTMQHVSEEDKRQIHQAFEEATETQKNEANANATELLKHHKYGVEEHIVKTDDGYYLTMFRIHPNNHQAQSSNENQSQNEKENQASNEENTRKRPVVLLMHGVLGSADDWLLMGPEKSLAYMLADAGFDVWLGNTRGNKYSRRHASKHESNPDFWKFSMDEIALHDVPSMIDHALKMSHKQKLYYVGHSQGNTALFALAATRPEYREKVAMMYALSPMVYMTNVRSPLLRMIAPNSRFYDRLHDKLGHGEFNPNKELIHTVGGNMCEKEIGCKHVCSNINFVMTGVDTAGMDYDLIPSIVAHLPAGTSTRQIKQFGQGVASREFRKYDYGASINKKIYGQREPPKYDLTEAKVPVTLYSSEEDWLAHPQDVERLRNELPDVREHFKVPEKHFSNMDFQFSKKAPEVVYKRLIESIQNN